MRSSGEIGEITTMTFTRMRTVGLHVTSRPYVQSSSCTQTPHIFVVFILRYLFIYREWDYFIYLLIRAKARRILTSGAGCMTTIFFWLKVRHRQADLWKNKADVCEVFDEVCANISTGPISLAVSYHSYLFLLTRNFEIYFSRQTDKQQNISNGSCVQLVRNIFLPHMDPFF